MRLLTATLLLSLSGTLSAAAPVATFSGRLVVDDTEAHCFDLKLAIGKSRIVAAGDSYAVELSAISPSQSIARLKDIDGNTLHEATANGPVQDRQSFVYLVCDSVVQFIAPAPADLPKCH